MGRNLITISAAVMLLTLSGCLANTEETSETFGNPSARIEREPIAHQAVPVVINLGNPRNTDDSHSLGLCIDQVVVWAGNLNHPSRHTFNIDPLWTEGSAGEFRIANLNLPEGLMVLGTALRVANRCDQLASIRFTQNGESLSIAETLALRFLGNLFEPNSIGLQAEDIIDDLTHRDTTERDLLEYFRRYLGRLY